MKERLKPATKSGLLILGGAALLYVLATSRRGALEAQKPVQAPDFPFPDPQGKPVSLSSFKGRPVLLDFWATWCGPCQDELPDLKSLQQKYKDKGFTILGVSMDAGEAGVVDAYVRNHQVPYPILMSGGDLPAGYPVPGLPTAFLIDGKGLIVRKYLGPQAYEDLAQDVEKALAR